MTDANPMPGDPMTSHHDPQTAASHPGIRACPRCTVRVRDVEGHWRRHHVGPFPGLIGCDTCRDAGLVDWMIESDPNCYQEPDADGKVPCPDCATHPQATTDQRPQQRSGPGWEWRPASGHESQPLAEWWVEQAVVKVVAVIARRAHRRGDTRTFQRMLAVSLAGADAEKAAARSDQDDHA